MSGIERNAMLGHAGPFRVVGVRWALPLAAMPFKHPPPSMPVEAATEAATASVALNALPVLSSTALLMVLVLRLVLR